MPKSLNHGPICARILTSVPKLTQLQQTKLFDALDGMTEAALLDYTSRKEELAKVPLQPRDEQILLQLSEYLGLATRVQSGVMTFTAADQESLTKDLKHLETTLLNLSQQIGQIATGKPGAIKFTATSREALEKDMKRIETALLNLSQQLGRLSTGQPGVMNFTDTDAGQDCLANTLMYLTKTDC